MSDIAISVEGLSKSYKISHQRNGAARYKTLREDIVDLPKRVWSRVAKSNDGMGPETFWALKDVSFKVKQGEVVGIIGRNGAGKSTLLKILSRITEPISGEGKVYGRVGSLLEVGTGFHPELSGRENIFLNGAILGMTRTEVRAKFDEIVAFAEIEKFLDTPVKRYSSGMYVRLAFAVAAHLDPEILLVDEVLAVGDADFQRKCLGKMGEVARAGRTVLFVSHNTGAINRLCSRCIVLEHGELVVDGDVGEATARYLNTSLAAPAFGGSTERSPRGSHSARLCFASIRLRDSRQSNLSVAADEEIGIEMQFEVLAPGAVLVPNFHFYDAEGQCLFVTHQWQSSRPARSPGTYRTVAWVPPHFFNEGTITVGVALTTYKPYEVHFYEPGAVAFQIFDQVNSPTRGDYPHAIPGAVRPLLNWTEERVTTAGTLQQGADVRIR